MPIPAPLLVVTDRHGSERPLVDTVQAALDAGARWIWFRDRDMAPTERRVMAEALLARVRAAGGTLTIGGDPELASAIGADGVQVSAASAPLLSPVGRGPNAPRRAFGERRQSRSEGEGIASVADPSPHHRLPPRRDDDEVVAALSPPGRGDALGSACQLLGVSGHSLADLRAASAAGADYATLSPIFSTASKPGYGPALGLENLRAASAIGLPVIALGGIGPEQASACIEAGAAGIAVMGAIMRADDPAAVTRKLLSALT